MQDLNEWIIIHLGGALLALIVVAAWVAIFSFVVLEFWGWLMEKTYNKLDMEDEDEEDL